MNNIPPRNVSFGQSEKFKQKWFSAHEYLEDGSSIDQMIQGLKAFENSNLLFNDLVVVNRVVDFKPLFVSKKVKQLLGYTQDEIAEMGAQTYFNLASPDQPNFWENLLKWTNKSKTNIPFAENKRLLRYYICGLSLLHKNGSKKRFLIRYEAMVGENFEIPKAVILYLEDISHFIKGDNYWMLQQYLADSGIQSKFYTKKSEENNLLTEREIEVLKLVANGETTKEVASKLKISPDTVSQHRKNMIRKTYAKDTSALIHFCKTCDVI